MLYVKKIIDGKCDGVVHKQLSRFSKGNFVKGLINISVRKKDISFKCSYDLCGDLFGLIADNCDKVKVNGIVMFSPEIKEGKFFEFVKESKRMNVGEVNKEMDSAEMKELYKVFSESYILLNVSSEDFSLVCKKKLPKPGKEVKADFCKGKLPLKLLKDLVWEEDVKKKVEISHEFIIDDLVVPDELSDSEDYALIRKMSMRKGKMIRHLEADGVKTDFDSEFCC